MLLHLAWKSLLNRKLTTLLTLASIACSVGLLLAVEQVRTGARDAFANTISGTDLIVGGRSGSINLLLYSVFRIGNATNNVSYEAYQHFANHRAVEWTIPYSLGDSHKGYRVVGTTSAFYEHYRYYGDRKVLFASGAPTEGIFDVVLGSDAARVLGYKMGDKITLSHGMTEAVGGAAGHDDKPFTVTGILAKTGTPIDRSLYISLYGMEAIHVDWQEGAPPMIGEEIAASEISKDRLEIHNVTAFLLRAKRRIDSLRLQREVNTYAAEPLMAILPGVTLAELWNIVGYAEDALRIVSVLVVIVGFLGMLVAIYTTLEERRREMAILRAVGVGQAKIATLLIMESGLLTVVGSLLGISLVYGAAFAAQPLIEQHFGLYLPIRALGQVEYLYLICLWLAGFALGVVPAWKAYRNSLADGLSIRL
ncbi:MAG: FtsX-like permease family protein [Bryobacterales bacterium]|nr:FtsX-like permease family protein [Bryobacterales bacterium]